jgi:signal transduction histidine kinase
MQDLVEDLRITYQLKNEALPLEKEPVNLVGLLREVVIDLLNDPSCQGAQVNFAPAAEEIYFNGDSHLLQRAFTNLILNAVVHNPIETPVNVSIRKEKTIYIVIQDQGKGIAPEDVERLFERYYRGTNTGVGHKGSGLGMAIARQVVEAHGGRLEVRSQESVGTSIEIRFGEEASRCRSPGSFSFISCQTKRLAC